MKSLEVAPLTREDLEIWRRLAFRYSIARMCMIVYAAEAADRRDADLMLHAQRHKRVAALQRTDDGSRIDLRLGMGISIAHLGLKLTRR